MPDVLSCRFKPELKMKRKVIISLAAAFHALLMIVMTLMWLGRTNTLDDELILIQFTAYFRKFILHDETPPERDRFLFINVAWDKQFIPKKDKDGFRIGVQAVTDREKLGRLFQIMNETEEPAHKLIVTDVFFKDSSATDSLIRTELARLKKQSDFLPQDSGRQTGLSDFSIRLRPVRHGK